MKASSDCAMTLSEALRPLREMGVVERAQKLDLGKSVEGRPLVGYRVTEGPVKLVILGGVHGDEAEPVYFLKSLLEESPLDVFDGLVEITVVPEVNPDALHKGTKNNANGVDLNRNFDTEYVDPDQKGNSHKEGYHQGDPKNPEPENKWLVDRIEQGDVDMIMSFHSHPTKSVIDYDVPHDKGDLGLTRNVATLMAYIVGNPAVNYIGHPTPRSLGTLAKEKSIPLLTPEFEGGSRDIDYRVWELASIEAITHLARQSPKLKGALKDRTEKLVDLGDYVNSRVSEGIVVDSIYASKRNFMGQVVRGYKDSKKARATEETAQALLKAQEILNERPEGYRIKVFDAYRPPTAVSHMVRWAHSGRESSEMKKTFYPNLEKEELLKGWLSPRSNHMAGRSLDVTLVDSSGKELDMGSVPDFLGKESNFDHASLGKEQKRNREILREVMTASGFFPYDGEYWHFSLDKPGELPSLVLDL